MSDRFTSTARLRFHVRRLLSERGPLCFDEILEALEESGLEVGPDEDRLFQITDDIVGADWQLLPGRPVREEYLIDLVAVAQGVTFTIPVDELSVRSDTLPIEEAGLLYELCDLDCTLPGGAEITFDAARRREEAAEAGDQVGPGLALPEGWFAEAGAKPGGYLAFTLHDSTIHGEAVAEPPATTPELTSALRASFDLLAGDPPQPVRAAELVANVLAAAYGTRTVLPPLDAWLATADLSPYRALVVPNGFDVSAWSADARLVFLAEANRFDDDDYDAYVLLEQAVENWRDAGLDGAEAADLARGALAALGRDPVLDAFCDEQISERMTVPEVTSFALRLLDHGKDDRRSAPAAWVLAEAASRAGDVDEHERWIDVALRFDPTYPRAIYDRFCLTFDRGDAVQSLALLKRLGFPDDEHDPQILHRILRPATADVPRNAPCPCGSGRKYKQCHQGKTAAAPLDERLTWLYRKANLWLGRRHFNEVIDIGYARAVGTAMDPMAAAEEDPLVADLVLTEGGRFMEWLAERGSLLPDDEALLAGQWALVDRSVFEVTEVRAGAGLTLRNLRTGDVIDVDERAGSTGMPVGQLVLLRPLPTGTGRLQIFGGVTLIPDSARDRALDVLDADPSAADVARFVASLEMPPHLTNTEGEETVMCELLWEVADIDALVAGLDAELDRENDAEVDSIDSATRWLWKAVIEGGAFGSQPTIRASFELVGTRLSASMNSEERAEACLAQVARLDPGSVVVEDVRAELDELRDDAEDERELFADDLSGDDGPTGMLDIDDLPAEMQVALWERIAEMERAWVDESIPALGGATPRQALDDPTRRDDLLRLLDHMDAQDARLPAGGFGMRVAELRRHLGLPVNPSELRLP